MALSLNSELPFSPAFTSVLAVDFGSEFWALSPNRAPVMIINVSKECK